MTHIVSKTIHTPLLSKAETTTINLNAINNFKWLGLIDFPYYRMYYTLKSSKQFGLFFKFTTITRGIIDYESVCRIITANMSSFSNHQKQIVVGCLNGYLYNHDVYMVKHKTTVTEYKYMLKRYPLYTCIQDHLKVLIAKHTSFGLAIVDLCRKVYPQSVLAGFCPPLVNNVVDYYSAAVYLINNFDCLEFSTRKSLYEAIRKLLHYA